MVCVQIFQVVGRGSGCEGHHIVEPEAGCIFDKNAGRMNSPLESVISDM